MKYKAIAINLTKDNHPVHNYSNSLQVIQTWAKETAEKEQVRVDIYRVEEVFVDVVVPQPK